MPGVIIGRRPHFVIFAPMPCRVDRSWRINVLLCVVVGAEEEIVTGGKAEPAQIPVRCSSSAGSRRRNSAYGLARRLAVQGRAATIAMPRLWGPLRVPATTGGEARLAGGGAVWTSH